ncbi:MAG: TetR/AcrR family transcriptional regulator [Bacteroides sp.]|nr:TetR/AcrR family transcriptional regulator [Bacteroides sp.]
MNRQERIMGTKQRILESVLPLFLVTNYEAITIALIENATGKTRGTIYKYFNNKEDIFCQAVLQYYNSPLNVLYSVEPHDRNIQSYWEVKMEQIQKAYGYLKNFGIFHDTLSITHYIEMQALRIIPWFRQVIISQKLLNERYWTQAVKNTPNLLDPKKTRCKKMPYQRLGEIYNGLYLKLCSMYPDGSFNLPDITLNS